MLSNKPPRGDDGRIPPWGTLIVCPLSLIDQWEKEITSKIEPAFRPSILKYHGQRRPKNPHELVKYDIIITTYSTLTGEYPKPLRDPNSLQFFDPPRFRKKGPLYKCRYFRVILDEAHAAKVSATCLKLPPFFTSRSCRQSCLWVFSLLDVLRLCCRLF